MGKRSDDPCGGEFKEALGQREIALTLVRFLEQAIGDHLVEGVLCHRRIEPEVLVEIAPADARRVCWQPGDARQHPRHRGAQRDRFHAVVLSLGDQRPDLHCAGASIGVFI